MVYQVKLNEMSQAIYHKLKLSKSVGKWAQASRPERRSSVAVKCYFLSLLLLDSQLPLFAVGNEREMEVESDLDLDLEF